MLVGVDSEPRPPPGRRQEINTRLDAVRSRLTELRERDQYAVKDAAAAGKRQEAATRHASEAHAFAAEVLAASVHAFRRAAEAHERVASMHKKAAAAEIGDVQTHERQVGLHWAAAAADWHRAERAQSLLSKSEREGPAAVSDKPRNGVAT